MASDRAYYSDSIAGFLGTPAEHILGQLTQRSEFDVTQTQRDAWLVEANVLRTALASRTGSVYFEYSIPRLGKRIDVVLLIGAVIFVLEFKVGESAFTAQGRDQVWDYGLDLKNFHETSFTHYLAPILVATEANATTPSIRVTHGDRVFAPIECDPDSLATIFDRVIQFANGQPIDSTEWEKGRYCPTPTIIEAAMALYKGHSVSDISRSDASAINLSETSNSISEIIRTSRQDSKKSICFVTGVPGAGKTLVGLNIATTHFDRSSELYSVFLSGNGPLVKILREALSRDKVREARDRGVRIRKTDSLREVSLFIQNVHHFRDDCLIDEGKPPIEHVAIFDEAQRAWDLNQTASFMLRKKGRPDFDRSEPEFLISCLDRHRDWAVVVCLVGGGQEINTGEAGIAEWIESLNRSFPDWHIYISSRLSDSEYAAGHVLDAIGPRSHVNLRNDLHLSVSMRSFRAENVSLLVKQLLDIDAEGARNTLQTVKEKYPFVITRNLGSAKRWLRDRARGSERYGIMVSSQAERLKPHAIDVKSPMDPVHWFLDGKEDVRSSFYLEDVATEFDVQGLEVDWGCVTWDADFRQSAGSWQHWSFVGKKWNRIIKDQRKVYQKNAYRVLLTRARQGMVVVVPEGDEHDPTRKPEYYDSTFEYLYSIGFDVI